MGKSLLLGVMLLWAEGVCDMTTSHEEIVLGGGCFWCLEAIFQQVKGVVSVESGYSGGQVKDPTYEQVCSGSTGHAEAVKIVFNPNEISLHDLLLLFFHVHDPTTLNRQGNDVGTQYRSVIFFNSKEQKAIALRAMAEVEQTKLWSDLLVTELRPFDAFYSAEEYHRNYFKQHPTQGYCRFIIAPKVAKFRKEFPGRLQ